MANDTNESEQLTEILRQLEAIRENMLAIVQRQSDIALLIKEDDKLRAARQKEKQKVSEANFWYSDDRLDLFDFPKEAKSNPVSVAHDNEQDNQYVFCFDIDSRYWHIRKVEGPLYAYFKHGGIRSRPTCGRVVSLCEQDMWNDIMDVPVSKGTIFTNNFCSVCVHEYLEREGEDSDGDKETNQRGETKG